MDVEKGGGELVEDEGEAVVVAEWALERYGSHVNFVFCLEVWIGNEKD